MTKLRIPLVDGAIEVDADAAGDLAVHRGVGRLRDAWVISHAATGLRIQYRFPTKNAALLAAQCLNEVADWDGIIRQKVAGLTSNVKLECYRICEQFGGQFDSEFGGDDDEHSLAVMRNYAAAIEDRLSSPCEAKD